jgi:acetyl-CoA carboxylase biotin carboxyl carrier protein
MDLTNDDVADILALLDSLPYDEFDLQTPRFRLILRRSPSGWTQSTQVLSAPDALAAGSMSHRAGNSRPNAASGRPDAGAGVGAGAGVVDGAEMGAGAGVGAARDAAGGGTAAGGVEDLELVGVRAPLPGTFYRAPRPGAAPFVEVGSRVDADTVIGIVETMKLMNSVHAGVAGEVAEFCVANAEFTERGATLLRIRADR